MTDNVIVPRELLEYLADLGDDAIQRMGSYLAEKHGEQRYVDAARAILGQPKAVPFGWITEDYLTDRSATTYDPEMARRWIEKGWPVTPLYAPSPAMDAKEE